ncbi:MAG TPA: M20/M25/M40 family metallo-hydrolase [Terriglobia bacterium]|nr:M20/M25/M40 family metallo-hydrolase [Terriglobia bacterium]
MRISLTALAALVLLAVPLGVEPAVARVQKEDALAREIFRELIEINTTESSGNTTTAAEAVAARLKNAGFPESDVQVLAPSPRKGNLVARYRGNGRQRPLLLLAHLDVVEALREDWTTDPFALVERAGFFYGRGAIDDKAMAAIWTATFIRLRGEGYTPDRDLILALTADEEGGPENGVKWLLENHRELIDAEWCLNEGGGSQSRDGRPVFHAVQMAEKTYQNFLLETRSPGGHSSRPSRDNAIYRLAAGLTRLEKFEFPIRLTEVTTTYYRRMADLQIGQPAADMRAIATGKADKNAVARITASPYDNALLRTTCVATRLDAGHADNALPQAARALVNCRILPGESADATKKAIVRALQDDRISITAVGAAQANIASPVTPAILETIERVTETMWPGTPVIPTMSTGATDGMYLRLAGIPTYGVPGLFSDPNDNRAHGMDERIGVREFYDGREFLYRLVRAMSS